MALGTGAPRRYDDYSEAGILIGTSREASLEPVIGTVPRDIESLYASEEEGPPDRDLFVNKVEVERPREISRVWMTN